MPSVVKFMIRLKAVSFFTVIEMYNLSLEFIVNADSILLRL